MKAKITENLFKKTLADFLNLTDLLRGKTSPHHVIVKTAKSTLQGKNRKNYKREVLLLIKEVHQNTRKIISRNLKVRKCRMLYFKS